MKHPLISENSSALSEKINHGLAYRPDLDGLRAVAIILVMLQHMYSNFGLFHGGLGVDIFFVLSGYLITRILVTALDRGTFSFSDFYARRVKRLFPTLVVTFVGALCVGFWVLPAYDFGVLSAMVASSGLSITNYALSSGAPLFHVDPRGLPFGQLWSLALEEQFYLIFPWVLVGMYRFSKLKQWIIPLFVVLGILSWYYWYVGRTLIWITYYSPLARSWELLMGVVLAIGTCSDVPKMGLEPLSKGLRTLWIAINSLRPYWPVLQGIFVWAAGMWGAVIIVLWWMGDQVHHRMRHRRNPWDDVPPIQPIHQEHGGMGLVNLGCVLILLGLFAPINCPSCVYAIFATLGTAMVIGAGPHTWLARLLSASLMVYIGRISYALYVVHYPVFVIWGLARGAVVVDHPTLAGMMVLTFVLAAGIYHGVEKKTRTAPYLWRWVAAMGMCVAMGLWGYWAYIGP